MKPILNYTGRVTGGQLKIVHRAKFDAELLHLEGDEVEIEVKKKKRRSGQLNRYYWGVVVALIQEGMIDQGNDVSRNDVHYYLKYRFNYKELVNKNGGEVIQIPDTTTELTNTQFMEYMEKCKQFAAEFLSVVIPEPMEQLTLL